MKTLLTLFLSILTLTGFSQSIDGEITLDGVITSTGQSFTESGITLDFAAGQPIIMDTTSGDILFDAIEVGGTVSIVEQDEVLSLIFYPNPTTDFIQTDIQLEVLSVYNLSGALVKQVNKSSNVNVNDLSPGTYILVAQTQNQVSTFKFIKK